MHTPRIQEPEIRPPGAAGSRSGASLTPFARNPWLAVILLTLLAAALRGFDLNSGLWWDEIYFLVLTVRHPLAQILTVFPADTQHPFYSVLARLSLVVFGDHPWAIRLPAAIFGTASVPLIYALAVSVTRRSEALLAAAFLAVSYHHVWFSQNARGYSTLAFFALAATLFLLRGLRTGKRSEYAAYAVCAALGAYTHLTMVFLVASHVLIVAAMAFGAWRRGEPLAKWKAPLQAFSLAAGLGLFCYLPIAPQVQNLFMHHPSAMRAVSTPRWAFWEALRGLSVGLGTGGAVAVAGLLAAFGAWSYFRQSRLVFALFVAPGAVTAAGALLARGTMYPRFYFFLIGFAILILVRGIGALSEWIASLQPAFSARVLAAAMAVAFFAFSAVALAGNYRYPKQDFEGALRFVDSVKQSGDAVVTAGASEFPYQNYFLRPWQGVDAAEPLHEICRRSRVVWGVYTFPRYLQASAPEVFEIFQHEFALVRVFHGTVGDGDVYVVRFPPG